MNLKSDGRLYGHRSLKETHDTIRSILACGDYPKRPLDQGHITLPSTVTAGVHCLNAMGFKIDCVRTAPSSMTLSLSLLKEDDIQAMNLEAFDMTPNFRGAQLRRPATERLELSLDIASQSLSRPSLERLYPVRWTPNTARRIQLARGFIHPLFGLHYRLN